MEKQWYVVNTYSGHENKVKEKLEMRAQSMDMKDYIYRVVIPTETVVENKDGVQKEKVKKMFPGYILVEMVMSDEAWYVVRNTPGVTGFIGSSGKGAKPTPLQPYEVDKILNSMGMSRLDVNKELEVGTKVKIIAGPFNGMFGTIDSIDLPNQKINLIVDLFGQETSVEVEMSQIEVAA
ncbi:MAG TPA: transcription termination/antitermination protein NusG [Candidatus Faecenecus gallistercoris]|jgi:transcriptional antiterminator NusG|uniref:Transcription termination/antitermination protein NusG n=1 Tax=Candidatus Faecenecus gallistercoris TaxID=2840793 RepID=A0A9D1CLL3_9FIRM|nr:transcription termination/antitermination protein NusG [Bacillota bacterium]MDY4051402.1 transcription termination/antitermination protein NusG [Candidatus Faecenecus gallistercoris]CDE08953.1 transcription antitermination protein nusG [Bacillus sp. CAG:988]MDD7102583.1 transcription termination/antitermination protein NusG [Bacillota bacterium]PWL72589.1 MAG: transcription termination/antitermination protein NusG [Bacillota bacterium]